jgi:hypothetical protein
MPNTAIAAEIKHLVIGGFSLACPPESAVDRLFRIHPFRELVAIQIA